jgi:hypothetical protein
MKLAGVTCGKGVTSHAQGSIEASEQNVSSTGECTEHKFPVKLLDKNWFSLSVFPFSVISLFVSPPPMSFTY